MTRTARAMALRSSQLPPRRVTGWEMVAARTAESLGMCASRMLRAERRRPERLRVGAIRGRVRARCTRTCVRARASGGLTVSGVATTPAEAELIEIRGVGGLMAVVDREGGRTGWLETAGGGGADDAVWFDDGAEC